MLVNHVLSHTSQVISINGVKACLEALMLAVYLLLKDSRSVGRHMPLSPYASSHLTLSKLFTDGEIKKQNDSKVILSQYSIFAVRYFGVAMCSGKAVFVSQPNHQIVYQKN